MILTIIIRWWMVTLRDWQPRKKGGDSMEETGGKVSVLPL